MARIQFDPEDKEGCERAFTGIALLIKLTHGEEFLMELFSKLISSKSALRQSKNTKLMVRYIRSGLSIEKCAAMLAEENKSLPKNERHGPYGTRNAEAMKRQIKRQKGLMAKYPEYRRIVETIVALNKEPRGDIS
jgi:adenine specific DNA methylase Mod